MNSNNSNSSMNNISMNSTASGNNTSTNHNNSSSSAAGGYYGASGGGGGGHHEYKSSAIFPYPKQAEARNAKESRQQLSNGMTRSHRILSPQEIAQGRMTRWMELEIVGKVRNLSLELWNVRHLTSLFLNGNQLQRIPPEISLLNNLTLLDLSHNKLRSLPVELGDMISLVHLYLNYNHIRVLPYELGKLFRISTLGLHGNPLSPDISKLYHEQNGTQKLLQHLLDHLAINTDPPPERQWIMARVPQKKIYAPFSVLCYNVLCDKYATTNIYSYCPTWALNWEYRKKSIMQEIRHYSADIITLQEVETEQYRILFKPELEALGYAGIFSPKSRAKTMQEGERKYVDGCAIFWKVDKFQLQNENLIEFTQMAITSAEGNENMLNRVMTRDNIALAAVLGIKEGLFNYNDPSKADELNLVGTPLVVCCAHIHWDPEFCDVKLVQTMMLVQRITQLLKQLAHTLRINNFNSIPTLICGDLNSLPQSGVYEYMTRGKISKTHADFKQFRDDECLSKLADTTSDSVNYYHALKMESAYEPHLLPFSNYTLDFKGVIDYIFGSCGSLVKMGVLGALDPLWLKEHKIVGCPHPHVPSDHIPLLAQFAVQSPMLNSKNHPFANQQPHQQHHPSLI